MFKIQYRYSKEDEWSYDTSFDTFDEAMLYMRLMEETFGYGSSNYVAHRLVITTEVTF